MRTVTRALWTALVFEGGLPLALLALLLWAAHARQAWGRWT